MPLFLGDGAASLARTGSVALAENSTGVGYAISHVVDRPWHFADILERTNAEAARFFEAPGGGKAIWTEAMGTAAFGSAALILVARTGQLQDRALLLGSDAQVSVINQHDVQAFMGTARPNASFLYRGSRYTEVFLRIPSQRKFDLRDGLVLGAVIGELSAAAAERGAPIFFLQAPAAAPPRSPQQVGSDDEIVDVTNDSSWRPSQSFGVRFAVGFNPLDARGRLEFFGRLADFATRTGVAVWVGDRRGDRRGGDWFRTVGASRGRYEEWSADNFGAQVDEVPTHGYPITVVGPARVGTTHEIVSCLGRLGVPILASSISALEDLALIHLLVPVKRATDARNPLNERTSGPAEELLRWFVGAHCALQGLPADADLHAFRLAPDYTAYGGRLVRLHPHDAVNERAVWGAWQVPKSVEALPLVLETLKSAIDDVTGCADRVNVEYLLCRRISDGSLHGRCKLAMPSEISGLVKAPRKRHPRDDLCQQIETAWRSGLESQMSTHDIEVELAWREFWLGRRAVLTRSPT